MEPRTLCNTHDRETLTAAPVPMNLAASPSYSLTALPGARAAAWEMKSEVAGSQLQFLGGRCFPGERRHGSAGSLTPNSRSSGREASRPGLALGKTARGGWEGQEQGAATPGGQEKSGPRTAGAKHGGRGSHGASRESRGPAANPGQKEPASSIYFRDLKPTSGSPGGVPMTTDVGSRSSCCCPMTSLSIPSRSCSGWLLSSSWCSSCWLGQPPVPQVQRDHHPHSCVLRPQHLPSRLGHELTLEKLQPLCLDRRTSNAVCIPETSGSVILLLLQTDCRETG